MMRHRSFLSLLLLNIGFVQIAFSQEEANRGLEPFAMAGQLSFPDRDEVTIGETDINYIFRHVTGELKEPIVLNKYYEDIKTLYEQTVDTLEYARKNDFMIDLSSKGQPVQIPVIRTQTGNVKFRISENIRTKREEGPSKVNFFVEDGINWQPTTGIQVRLKQENQESVVLGYICNGCSKANMDKVFTTYQKLIKEALSAGKNMVELNFGRPVLREVEIKDIGKVLVTNLVFDFEDVFYDPYFIAIIPNIFAEWGDIPRAFSFYEVDQSMGDEPFCNSERLGSLVKKKFIGVIQGMTRDNKIREIQVRELERTFRRVLSKAKELRRKVRVTTYKPAIYQRTTIFPQTFLTISDQSIDEN